MLTQVQHSAAPTFWSVYDKRFGRRSWHPLSVIRALRSSQQFAQWLNHEGRPHHPWARSVPKKFPKSDTCVLRVQSFRTPLSRGPVLSKDIAEGVGDLAEGREFCQGFFHGVEKVLGTLGRAF